MAWRSALLLRSPAQKQCSSSIGSKGRDFAAWLGLVPRQISTGDRTILGKVSKRALVASSKSMRMTLDRPIPRHNAIEEHHASDVVMVHYQGAQIPNSQNRNIFWPVNGLCTLRT